MKSTVPPLPALLLSRREMHSYSTSENVLYVIVPGVAWPGMSPVDSAQLLGAHFYILTARTSEKKVHSHGHVLHFA